MSPEREIYISNNEIKRLTVLSSDSLNLKEDSVAIQQSTEDYFTAEVEEENQYADVESLLQEKKLEPISLLSFVFGLLGFFGLGALGWGTAIVLSKSGINNIDKEPNKYKGRGFAVAGKVLGIIGLTLTVIAVVLLLILLAMFL